MALDSLLSRVLVYSALAALAGGLLMVYFLLKLELRRRTRKLEQRMAAAQQEFAQGLAALRSSPPELTPPPVPTPAPQFAPARPGSLSSRPRSQPQAPAPWSYHQRNEILELHSQGLEAADIAARLSVPESEVALLLRVHRILQLR